MKLTVRVAVAATLVIVVGCGPDEPTSTLQPNMARTADPTIGINVLLRGPATDAQLDELRTFGTVTGRLTEINALFMRARESTLPTIQSLPYVLAANLDAERQGAPVDLVGVTNFSGGLNTWNLDAINVTDLVLGPDRTIGFDGGGVYIGVLDSGLLDSWRAYFPEQRIATELAIAFDGAHPNSNAEPPNKWEHDQSSHGTHVTSTILGFQLGGNRINGVAPGATVIPVKVLNQNGLGFSSMVVRGILYIAALKSGPLAGHPVIINLSLGGSRLDAVERAAIDFAIARGVIVVASAGNRGSAGMTFPAAYAPVISVGASGWIGEWTPPGNNFWWVLSQVSDPTAPTDFYIPSFSSRALMNQDLDVVAPGSWILGPFQLNSGTLRQNFFFLGGTSQSAPHVSGIVALMAQKNPALTAGQAEAILESTAIPLGGGSRNIRGPDGTLRTISWPVSAAGSGLTTADAAVAATP